MQLYTLRELDEPLPEVLQRVAAAGFDGVEFADRVHDADTPAVREALEATGLEPVAAHVGLDRLEVDRASVLERCGRLGCDRIVVPHLPVDRFRTADRVERLASELIELGAELDDAGFELSVHTIREMFLPLFAGHYDWLDAVSIPHGGLTHLAWALDVASGRGEDGLGTETGFGQLVRASRGENLGFQIDLKSVDTSGWTPLISWQKRSGWDMVNVKPLKVALAAESADVKLELQLDPGLGSPSWSRATHSSPSETAVEVDTSGTLDSNGERRWPGYVTAGQLNEGSIIQNDVDFNLPTGQAVTLAAQGVGGTASVSGVLAWEEFF